MITRCRRSCINAIFFFAVAFLVLLPAGPIQAGARARGILVPLDDRPATLLFTEQIARIGGASLVTPPRGMLGRGFRPGDCESLAHWLGTAVEGTGEAIISSDMICYGGLVASRSAAVSRQEAIERLKIFNRLHRPSLRVEVLATIPRLDLRTSEKEVPYERILQKWAASGEEAYPASVPPEIVEEYLSVRQRNYQVLLALLDLAESGAVDQLVIGQDDSSPRGPNMKEQQGLAEQIRRRGLSGKALLLSGADELAMNMVTGWLCRQSGFHPRLSIRYDDPEAAGEIPPLESQPLAKTVADHCALAGALPAGTGEKADGIMLIATPQQDGELAEKEQEACASRMADEVLAAMKSAIPVGITDMQHLNQADAFLSEELIRRVPLYRLEAFAGWNTPSNSLGTALSQMVAHRLEWRRGTGGTGDDLLESEKTHQAFLLARFIDDYWYQAVLRGEVRPEADSLPADSDPLLNLLGPIGMRVRESLIPWGEKLFRSAFLNRTVLLPLPGIAAKPKECHLRAVLPWQRVFEVEVQADMRLEMIPYSGAAGRMPAHP